MDLSLHCPSQNSFWQTGQASSIQLLLIASPASDQTLLESLTAITGQHQRKSDLRATSTYLPTLPLERNTPLKENQPQKQRHNVRTRPRISPSKRRPAQQAAHEATRRDTTLRTSQPDRNPLQGLIERDPAPRGPKRAHIIITRPAARDCRQRPGFIGRCGLGRVPRLQGESAPRV